MKTVHEVSGLTGVSVRTLHHYDAIGLLKPTQTTEAGYRLYDDTALARLQTVLLFREMEFPLKEIKEIIDRPDFDRSEALRKQVELLELRRKRLDGIIDLTRRIIRTGENDMDFSAFDKKEIDKYTAEAKQKWGDTKAYKEYEQNSTMNADFGGLQSIFADMGKIKQLAPESDEAQKEVASLRAHITKNFYNCTPQILAGLGQMYVGDERFRNNIDSAGGAGTAEFASKAIECYCKNNE